MSTGTSTLIPRPLANPRLWAFPIIIVIIIAGFLPAMYLGGTINSSTSLKGLPIALVNEDTPVATPAGQLDAGKQMVDKLVRGIDPDKFAARMDKGTLCGAIVIPSSLSSRLVGLASSATSALLSTPISVQVTPHHALPAGTGGGLSAFYFALLLVLAGFTGSMIVSTLVDGSLGFVPSEFGPVYVVARHSGLSRRATLGVKWGSCSCSPSSLPHSISPSRWRSACPLASVAALGVLERRHPRRCSRRADDHRDLWEHRPDRESLRVRDLFAAVCGRYDSARRDPATVPVLGQLRADAPDLPWCAFHPVLRRSR